MVLFLGLTFEASVRVSLLWCLLICVSVVRPKRRLALRNLSWSVWTSSSCLWAIFVASLGVRVVGGRLSDFALYVVLSLVAGVLCVGRQGLRVGAGCNGVAVAGDGACVASSATFVLGFPSALFFGLSHSSHSLNWPLGKVWD